MIIGIGSDVADIRRFEAALKRFGSRFEKRLFTEHERRKAQGRGARADKKTMAATYAKRFAAKEACAKALGSGIRGIAWQEMEITNLKSGAPTLTLSGGALKRLHAITPKGKKPSIWLTLADDYPVAQAFVIISAE